MSEPVRISRRRARQLAVMGQLLDAPRRPLDRGGRAQASARSRSTRRRSSLAPSTWCCSAGWARDSGLPSSSACSGRSGRCSSIGCTSCRSRICRCTASRCGAIPHGPWKRHSYVREWLAANDEFVRYVLGELRRRGPLRARDLENRAAEGWRVGGWNDEGQSAPMLLDILWWQGKVMIVGRDGQQRIWDLASRSLPKVPAPPTSEMAARLIERQVRARGVTKLDRIGYLFDGDWTASRAGAPRAAPHRRDRAGRGGRPSRVLVHAPRAARHGIPRAGPWRSRRSTT